MKFGIYSKVYENSSLDDVMNSMQKEGLSYLHLNLETVNIPKQCSSIDDDIVKSVKKSIDGASAQVVSLSATYNLIHPDLNVRSAGIEYTKQLVSFAKDVGIDSLAICTGTNCTYDMWKSHPLNHSKESNMILRESLSSILNVCEEKQIRLLIEPEQANVIASPEDACSLLADMGSQYIGIIMDGSNLFSVNNDDMSGTLNKAFDLLGDYICLAHAKDFIQGDELAFVPAGRGQLDYQLYFSLIRQIPHICPVLMHGLKEEDIPYSFGFLKSI